MGCLDLSRRLRTRLGTTSDCDVSGSDRVGVVVSHPCDKSKDVARVGAPLFLLGWRIGNRLVVLNGAGRRG
jgi:hypothetical protein